MSNVRPRLALGALLGLFFAKLIPHLLLAHHYGYHGDELYFLACARHLSFGYVDHPPLVPWIAWLAEELGGATLPSLRLLPAVAGALTTVLAALLARSWGGGRLAQLLAGVAVIAAPVYLRAQSLLSLPAFEPFFWTLASYLVVLAIQRRSPRLWLVVGLVAGLGLLNKHTMLLWGAGLVVGFVLTPQRRLFRSPWLWAGGAVALVVFLPNLVWQMEHEWATLEFLRTLRQGILADIPRPLFLLGLLLYQNPLSLPLWIGGIVFLFSRAGAPYRFFVWQFFFVFAFFLATKGKPYYLAPAFPLLFAGGSVLVEAAVVTRGHRRLGSAAVAILVAAALLVAPMALPLLPLPVADRAISRLFGFAIDDPRMLSSEFHEQYGWPELAAEVQRVYDGLTPAARDRASILARHYAQASAIAFFSRPGRLPPPVSGHMSYFLWGPPRSGADTILTVGFEQAELIWLCGETTLAVRFSHPLSPSGDRGTPIVVCADPRASLADVWPRLRSYDHRPEDLRDGSVEW